jgi:threonine dehydratase
MTAGLTAEGIRVLVPRVLPEVSRHARRTPWLPSAWLSERTGGAVYLKCENLQVTGSFKVRGAVAALALLDPGIRGRGVVTSSTGNHGLALAHAARAFGAACTVVVPRSVAPVKERRIRALGARVIHAPHDGYDRTQTWTLDRLDELGGAYVSPFEDPAVAAGNGGTIAVEVDEQAPGLDALVVPCGGGGLVAGLAAEMEIRRPELAVIGVNSEASPGMWRSFREGAAILEIESEATLADGIEGGVGAGTFAVAAPRLRDVVLVSEPAVAAAVAGTARHDKLVIEGAAAVAVAAILEGKAREGRIGLLLSGGNIGAEALAGVLALPDWPLRPGG